MPKRIELRNTIMLTEAGKQPSSGTNRPVSGMRATGDCPGPSSHWLDTSSTKGDTWDRGKQIPILYPAMQTSDEI